MGETEWPEPRPYRFRHIIPLGVQLSSGGWAVSVQLYEDCLTIDWVHPRSGDRYIEYADDYAPEPTPVFRWAIEDDLGTEYSLCGGSGSGGDRGFRQSAEFEPAPPPEAKQIRLRSHQLGDEILVVLPDA